MKTVNDEIKEIFIVDLGSTSHMVNSLRNITKTGELKYKTRKL